MADYWWQRKLTDELPRSDDGWMEEGPNAYELWADRLNAVGDTTFAATGIPLAQRGFEDMGATDDPWRMARGAGEVGLAALPFAGPLARAAFATAPRTMMVGGAYGIVPNLVTEAEAAGERKKRSKGSKPKGKPKAFKPEVPPMPEPVVKLSEEPQANANGEIDIVQAAAQRDPRLKILVAEKARLENIINVETMGKGGYGARAQAAKADLDKVNADITKRIEPYLPFDQAYETANRNWNLIQVGVPALAALVTRGVGRSILNEAPSRFNSAVRQGEKAFDGTMFRRPNLAVADRKLAEIKTRLKNRDSMTPNRFSTDTAAPIAAGAVTGAELSVFPEQYNRRNTLPGTKEHTLANERLTGFETFKTMAPGALLGGLGGWTASHMPGRVVTPNIERGEAFVARMGSNNSPAARAKARDIKAQQGVDAAGRPPTQLTPPPTKPPMTPKDRWWKSAINKMRNSKSVDDALDLIDNDPDLARLNKPKRRKIITDIVMQNPNATPEEIAKTIRKRVTNLKKSGKFYSGAILSGMGASTLIAPDEEE